LWAQQKYLLSSGHPDCCVCRPCSFSVHSRHSLKVCWYNIDLNTSKRDVVRGSWSWNGLVGFTWLLHKGSVPGMDEGQPVNILRSALHMHYRALQTLPRCF
jgi:hypothetical protein